MMLNQRVLIVDDEIDYCQMYATPLTMSGFDVDCVHDGPGAVHAIETDPPDVLIIDHNLPGCTGLDVLAHLREAHIIVPVVIMVTGTHMSTAQQIRETQPHVDLLLAKPYSPFKLQQIVEKFAAG